MSKLLDPNFPFSPKSSPVFYGWVIVAAAVVGVACSLPGQTNGVGVFNDVLMDVTGLSRTQLSWSYCIGTVVSGLNLTLGGRLLDRFGSRHLVIHASVALGLILVLLANIDNLVVFFYDALGGEALNQICQDVFSMSAMALLSFAGLCVLFALLRFSGQGMLVLISRQMIGKWFDKRRGLAAAIAGVAISLSFGLSPVLLQLMINSLTWRGAWYVLALVSAGFLCFFGWLFFRDNPEECGLRMDGGADLPDHVDGGVPVAEVNFTLHEATRTWAFWLITLALSMQGVVGTAIPFHIDQFALDNGMSKETALTIFIPGAIIAPAVGWLVGWACDRYSMKLLLRIMCLFQVLGFLCLAYLQYSWGWWLCILGLGISGGFFGPLSTVAMPYFFGRRSLGAISGTMMKMMVIGSALGPLFFAYSHAWLDSFTPACYASAGIAIILLICAPKAVRPHLASNETAA